MLKSSFITTIFRVFIYAEYVLVAIFRVYLIIVIIT